MDIIASRQDVVDHLSALELGGEKLRVTTKLTDISTPCVFVALEDIDHYNVGGEATWRLYLVTANSDEERALEQLQQLLEVVLPAVSPAAKTEYVGLRIPEQSQPLPALLIRINATV